MSSTPPSASRKFIFRRENNSGTVKKSGNVSKRRLINNRNTNNPIAKSGDRTDLFSECRIKNFCKSCRYVNLPYKEGLQQKYDAGVATLKTHKVFSEARFVAPIESPQQLAFQSAISLSVGRIEDRGNKSSNQRVLNPRDSKQAATTSDNMSTKNNADSGSTSDPIEPRDRFLLGKISTTNRLLDMGGCPLNDISIGRFIRALRFHLNQSSLEPWDTRSGTGDLFGVDLKSSHITKEILIVFSVVNSCKKELKKIISLMRLDGHKINSAHMRTFNSSSAKLNEPPEIDADRLNNQATCLSQPTVNRPEVPTPPSDTYTPKYTTQRIAGTNKLRDRLCDINIESHCEALVPANPWQAINLMRRIEQFVTTSRQATGNGLEINCGSGIISMILAKSGYTMLGIDHRPQEIADAISNQKRNDLSSNIEFSSDSVNSRLQKFLESGDYPETIIIHSKGSVTLDTTHSKVNGLPLVELASDCNRDVFSIDPTTITLIKTLLKNSPKTKILHVSNNHTAILDEVGQICGSLQSTPTASASPNQADALTHQVTQVEAFDFAAQTDKLIWLTVITPLKTS